MECGFKNGHSKHCVYVCNCTIPNTVWMKGYKMQSSKCTAKNVAFKNKYNERIPTIDKWEQLFSHHKLMVINHGIRIFQILRLVNLCDRGIDTLQERKVSEGRVMGLTTWIVNLRFEIYYYNPDVFGMKNYSQNHVD